MRWHDGVFVNAIAPAVAEALDMFEAGMDFTDALHLCSNREAAPFATFDKRMKQRANKAAPGRHIEIP
ncbi:MAG: PIN domain-containing protein [Burkholderiales bacterium]